MNNKTLWDLYFEKDWLEKNKFELEKKLNHPKNDLEKKELEKSLSKILNEISSKISEINSAENFLDSIFWKNNSSAA